MNIMKGNWCPIKSGLFCQESSGCDNCAVQLNQLNPDERLLLEYGPKIDLIVKIAKERAMIWN